VWDIELLGQFLHRQELHNLITTSLRHFDGYLVKRDGHSILDSSLSATF
jgi:hypothetical protein